MFSPMPRSKAEQTIEFNMQPAIVAEACQSVLNSLGTVKTVSRQAGIIDGKFGWDGINITIKIAKKGDGAVVTIQTDRMEGLLTSGGAQKGLAKFIEHLMKHPKLAGHEATSAGW